MKRLIVFSVLLCIQVTTIYGQLTGAARDAASPAVAGQTVAASNPQPIVKQFKKTVIFLETDCLVTDADGRRTVIPHLGTGALVSHRDPRFPNIDFNYILTNRHVARPGIEDGIPCQVLDYKVRYNLKVATANGALSEIMSLGTAVPWFYPIDPSVDLAILPGGPDPSRYSFVDIPSSIFLTIEEAKKNQVVEGDSVLFTGLFVQFLGQVKLEPIVREGKIAMIPDEQVPTTLRTLGDIYLVDAHVFGGNSGSPMLVNLAGQRYDGLTAGYNYRLLGLISGYMQETTDFKLQAVASYAGTVVANSGIAIVVPAQQILELLNSAPLQANRVIVAPAIVPPMLKPSATP